ncbi:MAG: hypothetical protein IJ394_06440 [Bacteroidales bacterium]|nr:hypothetical protein [Bacteroidales bacterium]
MIRKLCIILLTAFMAAPLLAQPKGTEADEYSPKAWQWQVSMVVGNSGFFNEDLNSYLVPKISTTEGSIGLPNGSTDASGNMSQYLNISGFNNNSFNIVGLQGKVFLTDHWELNASFGVNIDLTPSRDYVEGDTSVPDMIIPDQQYINAQTSHNWYVTLGTSRYFKLRNPRVHPYLGVALTYQMARIVTMEPYIGEDAAGDDLHLYQSGTNIGQVLCGKAALVAGIEYSVSPGLVLGFEFHPGSYRYDVVQMAPRSFDVYTASHQSIRVFEMPVLKLGIRF